MGFKQITLHSPLGRRKFLRIDPTNKEDPLYKYYWEAEELAHELVQWAIQLKPKGKNFVICPGGGPGIMEAANRGAISKEILGPIV